MLHGDRRDEARRLAERGPRRQRWTATAQPLLDHVRRVVALSPPEARDGRLAARDPRVLGSLSPGDLRDAGGTDDEIAGGRAAHARAERRPRRLRGARPADRRRAGPRRRARPDGQARRPARPAAAPGGRARPRRRPARPTGGRSRCSAPASADARPAGDGRERRGRPRHAARAPVPAARDAARLRPPAAAPRRASPASPSGPPPSRAASPTRSSPGLPPITGLYASAVAGLAYALAGTIRQAQVGPTSTSSILTAAAIAPMARGDVAARDGARRDARADGRRDPARARTRCGSGSSPTTSRGRC